MRAYRLGVLLTAFLAGAAVAQSTSERVLLVVGETAEIDVGDRIGFACDDTRILRAGMVTRNGRNLFIVKGVAVGSTWCRIGSQPGLWSYLFEIVVRAHDARN